MGKHREAESLKSSCTSMKLQFHSLEGQHCFTIQGVCFVNLYWKVTFHLAHAISEIAIKDGKLFFSSSSRGCYCTGQTVRSVVHLLVERWSVEQDPESAEVEGVIIKQTNPAA